MAATELATLYLGDCADILPTLTDIDAVITDPPYAEKTHKGARTGGGNEILIDFESLTSKQFLEMNDAEFQKYTEDIYNCPQTAQEKMVVDFASHFWNERDKSWIEVSKIISNKLS